MEAVVLNLRIRDRVRLIVRDRIVSGHFKGGQHLEEVALASDLGVSRTPLREALFGLEEEGLVISRPHRGFVVAPADRQAVRDLYPILGSLEALAVETSNRALRDDVSGLRLLNARLQTARPDRAAAADRAFHVALRRRCPNQRLLDMLDRHEALAHRLDGAIRRGMADVPGSHDQHAIIVEAIAAGDFLGAAHAVRDHWRSGEQTVLAWLEQNDPR
ncbi:GntR family transcriptional regulator [Sphingomonas sp.]|uniref:GntR family transcriptional regulator n=1 Tax=Sphingomonas sp. TaxID=28214 RepID=UPI00286A7608|nr:GntR family transcriptional regulator [Sphingomonas sp.]